MDTISSSIIFGIYGGFIRSLVGIMKYFEKNKIDKKINWHYLFFSIFVAALVGGVAGSLADGDWRFSFLAGYAGADFIEGIYKIRMRQGVEI